MKLFRGITAAGAVVSILALSACDTGRQEEVVEPGVVEEPGQEQSQVIEREVETDAERELGGAASQKGQETLEGERTEITRETERVQEEVPTVLKGTEKADINRMDVDDFVALGLSREAAQNIVEYRDQQGEFSSVDQLAQVPGIEQSWLQKNKDLLGVSAEIGGEEREDKMKEQRQQNQ